MTPSLGLFGGVFDPPHVGHVALVRAAKRALDLERVVVVAADPGHKETPHAPAAARLDLARAAFPEDEVVLDRHPRTIDMLRARPEWHGAWFLLGADELETLGAWKEPAELLRLVRLGVAGRPGHRVELPDPERDADFELEVPAASRDVRDRLEAGEDVSALVPPAVLEIVRCEGLYGSRASYTGAA